MSPELDPQQRIFLWALVTSPGGRAVLKDMCVKLTPVRRRTQLESLGLIAVSGRPMVVELTDAGWQWCQDHMTTPLASRSPAAVVILQGLLRQLASFLQSQDHTVSIGHLVQQSQAYDRRSVAEPSSAIESAIQAACLELGGNRTQVRVRMRDLRPLLSDFQPDSVDQAILAMELSGQVVAMRLDNPDELSDADRAAALVTPAGSENHILYLQGTH